MMSSQEARKPSLLFDIADEVRSLGVRGAYFVIRGIHNAESNPEFAQLADEAVGDLQRQIPLAGLYYDRRKLPVEAIEHDPVLRGFRALHDRVGASNRKHVASSENLIHYVLRTGRLPHVNLVVDIYNLVSLETRLALGAHDVQKISGGVHLRITSGNEHFVPLGMTEAKPVRQGVYAYVDDGGDVLCYLEVRQVEKTKVTLDTSESFYIVQGNGATPLYCITSAMNRTVELTQRYCGGEGTQLAIVE